MQGATSATSCIITSKHSYDLESPFRCPLVTGSSGIHSRYFMGQDAVLTFTLSNLYYYTLWCLINPFTCERKENSL